MKILLVSATEAEISLMLAYLDVHADFLQSGIYEYQQHEIHVCVTGVGMVAAAVATTQRICDCMPDLVVQVGIGGTYTHGHSFELGQVVELVSDEVAFLGAENTNGSFLSLAQLQLLNGTARYVNPKPPAFSDLDIAHGLTVNTTRGFSPSIERLTEQYPQAEVETMEGAGFFHACLYTGTPFHALRGISNTVSERNRENWRIDVALENLYQTLLKLFDIVG